ncbi:unnamed protein product [Ranitomeya imitator]|uniref:PDZ domain-containing protein n=1 Tax=Ranitomeya imitator TaxID=111125 RepID=A0ABN9L7S9_9NEOB|nr:unnamed protein product [Ranitomeya imitator]
MQDETCRQVTASLVQRCVIIQRDENGFGLTVSGDNPVFVQSVKEDGAAMRAGVQTGDRIIKVNGTLVTHSNHLEVVKLIKSLVTRMNELDSYSSDQERCDYIIGDGSRPSSNVTDSPCSGQREKSFLEESPEKSEYLDTDSQSSMGSPSARFAHSIIGAEDEDFDAEPEQVADQCSCFQSMDLLKSHPAHLAVFIFHVVSQFDPAPLLCYLYGDLYQQTNPKETRRVFLEFYQFFLERTAHLRVSVPEDLALELACQCLVPASLRTDCSGRGRRAHYMRHRAL